jgi:photosystem II stability/assembly factor-like uncharacterized protein
MTKFITLSVWLLLLAVTGANAQEWVKITTLPETEFTVIDNIDGILVTASGNTFYMSTNGGATWQSSEYTDEEDIIVYSMTKYNNKIYLGTSIGVFSSPASLVHQPWNLDINTLPVTSFAEKDNVLYASVGGFGIIKLINGTAWMGFSNGLPSYSMDVNKILSTPAGLFAFAGSNGTFYKYDSGMGQWVEDYYTGGTSAGFHVDDAEVLGNILYVSRYNNVMRSDDLGSSWVQDKEGLNGGQNRHIYIGNTHIYCLTTEAASTTHISKRLKTETNTNWSLNTDSGINLPILREC